MPETNAGLSRAGHEGRLARNRRRLSDRGEDFLARFILPAIADRDREFLADIVELQLGKELHVGRKINSQIGRYQMNVQEPAWKVDIGIDVMRCELDEGIGPEIGL